MKDKELKLEEVKAPLTLGGASHILSLYINNLIDDQLNKQKKKTWSFFYFLFCPFQNFAHVDDQYKGRVDFLHRNSGGGSVQREYVAHSSNGRLNVRFTIMFMGACVAEGDKAMDTS